MIRNDTTWRAVLLIFVALSVLLAQGCSDPVKTATMAIKAEQEKDPYHVVHFPPGETQPIDGVWVDAWGGPTRIERGRAFDDTVIPYAGKTMWVYWKGITRVAPGRYRAQGSGWMSEADEPITISVVSEKEIIVRLAVGDRAYTWQSLDNPERFAADFQAAREAGGGDQPSGSSLEILRVETNPAPQVAPASPFDLAVDYRLGVGGEPEPAFFSYAILRGGELLMESRSVQLDARPGEVASRVVSLNAASDEGTYILRATIEHAGESVSAETALLIGSRDLLLDKLAGQWVCRISQGKDTHFTLTRVGDGLEGTITFDPERAAHWKMLSSSFDLVENRLVIKAREAADSLDCWYDVETVFEIGGNLDELEGKAEITDGNWCTQVGAIFNVTFVRVNP